MYFRAYDPARFIHYCADPDRYGHTDRRTARAAAAAGGDAAGPDLGGDGETAAPRSPGEPERRVVVEGNKAWKAAGAARREFLAGLIARKSAPAAVARFVADALTSMPIPLARWLPQAPRMPLFAELLGSTAGADGGVRKTTDKRLPLLMLASIAAAYEYGLTGAGDSTYVWRTDRYSTCPRDAAAVWLRFLADLGHTLSPIEQAVADGTTYTGDTPTGEQPADVSTDSAESADAPGDPGRADGPEGGVSRASEANHVEAPDGTQGPDGADDTGGDTSQVPDVPEIDSTADVHGPQTPDRADGVDASPVAEPSAADTAVPDDGDAAA